MDRRELIRGATAVSLTSVFGFALPTSGRAVDARMVDRLTLWAERLGKWDTPFSPASEQVATAQAEALSVLGLRCPARLRAQLYSALGELSHTVGYMAFDRGDLHAARAAWSDTLDVAGQADGTLGLSLEHRARASLARAQLAPFGGVKPHEALTWVTGPDDRRLTRAEHALAWQVRARAHAARGDWQQVVSAVEKADEQRQRACPETDPPWVGTSGEAEYLGDTGHALADLALVNPDAAAQVVREADRRLLRAATHSQAHRRTRLFSRLVAGSLSMRHVDPDRAVEIVEPALRLAPLTPSAQATALVGQLRRECAPHLHRPHVAWLHDELGGLA